MWRRLLGLLLACGLAGCATTPTYTIDDGRRIDDAVLAEILAFGDGQRALRPAIVRSAQLEDRDCAKQWELPFAAFSTATLPEAQRVAWVRALGMDERLRVIATSPASPLELGDRIIGVAGVRQAEGPVKMAAELAARRDAGRPFAVEILSAAGPRSHSVTPIQVCRGLVQLAPPANPRLQDYHWERAIHPLELVKVDLTEDEALWVVLWTQGLSEEGGGWMKAASAGQKTISAGFLIAQLVAVANPLAAASQIAGRIAAEQARTAAIELARQQLASQARELAMSQAQKKLQELAESVAKGQGVTAMKRAAASRGSLVGLSWVAGKMFDRADGWAAARMQRLQADPAAPFSLHRKLALNDAVANGLVFDESRFDRAVQIAMDGGYAGQALDALEAMLRDASGAEMEAMPLATIPKGPRLDDDGPGLRPQTTGGSGTGPDAPFMPLSGPRPSVPSTAPSPAPPGSTAPGGTKR